MTAKNEHKSGSLKLIKKDGSYSQDLGINEELYLQGAKVKIYAKQTFDGKQGWVKETKLENGTLKYEIVPYSEATEFTTNDKGEISIERLKYGTYNIFEISSPNGYDITKQDGYHIQNDGSNDLGDTNWVYLGTTEINSNNKQVEYQLNNNKYIDIKGKVWLDVPDTKANKANDLYDEGAKDSLVKDLTVNLYNTKTKEKIATTVTNDNGEYVFTKDLNGKKITYWEAAYCYVEFIYDNTRYITVNPFEGGENNITNNSKAQEEEITEAKLKDDNLTGTSGNNPGRAITLKVTNDNLTKEEIERNRTEELSKRLLTGYYNEETNTIENINLGIVEKIEPDHTIAEQLEYVKIKKGNYTFKYKYGENAVTEQGDPQSTVKLQNSKKSFTQSLYPSDIKYNIANGLNGNSDDAYKVYVVYKIEVTNNTTTQIDSLYSEKSLYLTKLTNSYDTSRFELSHDKLDGDESISSDFDKWKGTSGTASYDLNDSNKQFKNGIDKGQTESVYIQFKVTDSALNKLVTEEQLGESPTIAKSEGYHKYTRTDKNWKDNNTYEHTSKNEVRQNGSLYLKWKLFETRTISGTIFEDTKDESRPDERIGNGKYDSNTEKKLTDVVVSLMNAEDNTYSGAKDEEAYLYQDDLEQNPASGKWSRCKQKAVTKVDAEGTYSLKGVVPGNYYLKFTYGDGKTTITDVQGNPISVETKIQGENTGINSNYYKSTILAGPALNNDSSWYLNCIDGENYSIATDTIGTYYDKDGNPKENQSNIDIINARTTSTKEINHTSSSDKVVIDAISPNISINFEYRGNGEYQITDNQLNDLKTDCTGMSFGIIERPHTEIKLEKEISNVKLTLSNGTTLINGNPSDSNVSEHLTGIDGSNAKIETDYENIYGSTIAVDYKIKVINDSELDYATKEYYTKGVKGNLEPVTTAVTKIIDYVSQKQCNYKETSENAQESDEYTNDEGYTKEDYYENNIIETNEKNYKNQLLITNGENLTPKRANTGTSESSYTVSVSNLLPSVRREENLGWGSYSEVIAITNVTYTPQYKAHMGNYKAGDNISYPTGTSEYDNGQGIITVTPPTGKNKSNTIYIVFAVSLIVIAFGILIIKKKVL